MTVFEAIITYLSPFFGVALGWYLSERSERQKTLQEDRRKLKRTLFHLLEIRYRLNLFIDDAKSKSKYISLYVKRVEELISLSDVDLTQIRELLWDSIGEVGMGKIYLSAHEADELKLKFSESVDQLSEIDPIIAFRLYGREGFAEKLKGLTEASKNAMSKKFTDPKDLSEIENVLKRAEPAFLKHMIKDIEEVAIEIATRLDKNTLHEVKLKFDEQPEAKTELEMNKMINDLLMEVYPQLFETRQ